MSGESSTFKRPDRREIRSELKVQTTAFAVSIFLTILAFGAVVYAIEQGASQGFAVSFIIALAIVQVAFQAYIWMHLKDKGHGVPQLFFYMAVYVTAMTVIGLMFMSWWSA
ncbi:MAG: cytochrome C oxidase subunit IV family protein [Candidatus Carbobacillus altaicus]|uniref:Cytochrome c oxidase polypeptide IV n=1 Tax=Candidatus Carbonibacillus altaicus TaxID=2163959 RepID=A0A2R6Y4B9_9BACL|nr:cytochrome C oxidase subunit IV family protein [Candidatus Carbobacillus altaicus]PTQ57521.1 MAG: Cytochrome c oxidase polypeptide IV [Candidatus Carbobacillus altaicus]